VESAQDATLVQRSIARAVICPSLMMSTFAIDSFLKKWIALKLYISSAKAKKSS
jgi:hypothetical protein